MRISELKSILEKSTNISFVLPNGGLVPSHFHVTEVGKIEKNYIDCGGTVRHETKIGMQLWEENDYDHRLHPEKLLHILSLSEEILGLPDEEIEVEYQGDTINKFSLEFDGSQFLLTSTFTTCLAKESCGVTPKKKVNLADLKEENQCTPGGSCC